MANLVLAVGTSHGPSIQLEPEDWQRLGKGDAEDSRYDFDELIKNARPGLEQEIAIEKQRERHGAARAALRSLTQRIEQARPDAAVVISNTHRIRPEDSQPVFSVFRGATLPVARRLEPFNPEARFRADAPRPKQTIIEKPGEADLAEHLINFLIAEEFDVACHDRFQEGSSLDDAFAFSYQWLLNDAAIPVVPLQLSRYLPYQATPGRCYALGVALRNAIEAWKADRRVLVIASGGLSHQILDEELDNSVIDGLVNGDRAALSGLSRERLNAAPGTPEIINWITVAGAMAPGKMELVDYLPAYRSLAGTGHGLAFGYWRGASSAST